MLFLRVFSFSVSCEVATIEWIVMGMKMPVKNEE